MKGRKGKKANKNAAKHSAAAQPQQPTQKQRYDQQPVDSVPMQNQGTQSDEYSWTIMTKIQRLCRMCLYNLLQRSLSQCYKAVHRDYMLPRAADLPNSN